MMAKQMALNFNSLWRSLLKVVANVIVVLLFALLAFSCYRQFRVTGSINWLGLLAVNALFVCLFIVRRDATTISTSPALWVLAFSGSALALLMRPVESDEFVVVGNGIQFLGIALIIVAALSLRRSFGIVPANRGIRREGLYRVVRHPLYCAELLTLIGFVIANPSTRNALLWIGTAVLQFSRACAEEKFLSADPAYREYASRVKYRLIPRLI